MLEEIGAEQIGGTIVLVALFAGLFLLEQFWPLRDSTRSLWRRLAINLVVTGLALAVAALLVNPLANAVLETEWGGLLGFVPGPAWVNWVLGFLLLDLSFYYWHVANHRVGFLWRFHNVHHIDPDLDVTTAFRFHFGEMVMTTVFRVLQITLIGVSVGTYLVYEFVFTANTMFHHSNVRIPRRVERLLTYFLVTPRMHGIHHSQVERETKSNFSVVFSWWDMLHRSLHLQKPQSEITIGVPAYMRADDNNLWNVLLHPFRRQRDYWNHDITTDDAPPASSDKPPRRVGEGTPTPHPETQEIEDHVSLLCRFEPSATARHRARGVRPRPE